MSTEVVTPESTGPVSDGGPPLVRAGLRGFLDLGRFDVIAVIALVVLAFGLRFASPIFPDFLSGTGTVNALRRRLPDHERLGRGMHDRSRSGPPGVVGGVKVSHIDISVCGYVFDEIYFPVDAAKDLRQPAESYFDPEPPLAKLLMAPPIAVLRIQQLDVAVEHDALRQPARRDDVSRRAAPASRSILRHRRGALHLLRRARVRRVANRRHRHHRDLLRRALLLRLLITLAGANTRAVADDALRDGRRRRVSRSGRSSPRSRRSSSRPV